MSVDKKVSILFRIDCVVLSRALFLPFLSRNLLPSISDGECRVPFLSQLKSSLSVFRTVLVFSSCLVFCFFVFPQSAAR